MAYDHKKQATLNKVRATDPIAGDYWQEHFLGICVVLQVMAKQVIICKTKKDTDKGHRTWDLDDVQCMTKSAFKEWLSYDGIEGHWVDVIPEHHKWAADAFNELTEKWNSRIV